MVNDLSTEQDHHCLTYLLNFILSGYLLLVSDNLSKN